MDLQLSLLTLLGNICIMVEAKYCPIEIDGDVKYYICPRNEICCTFGCCISSNFHFYQLWYYWLMVILMFLLCSGGTWWYRYWLHDGHYPHAPPPTQRPHPRHRPPATRVAYHAGRNTVLVQQIWKPQRNGPMGYPTPPPSYSVVQNASGAESQSAMSSCGNVPPQVAKLKTSPYYQLYGPPPSYDSVVAERLNESDGQRPQPPDRVVNNESTSSDLQNQDIHHQDAHVSSTSSRSQQCDNMALTK